MLLFLRTAKRGQGRPFPWEEHIRRLKKMILQLVLFHVLSEGSLRNKKRGQTVNFAWLCPTWRWVSTIIYTVWVILIKMVHRCFHFLLSVHCIFYLCHSFHCRFIMKIYWTYFVHRKINLLSAFEKTLKRALRLVIYIFANIIVSFFWGGGCFVFGFFCCFVFLHIKFWFQYFR